MKNLSCWSSLHSALRYLGCLAVLCALLLPSSASADLADLHYKRAMKLYELKDYPKAIREFQAAYKVRQLPKILLNIGQVYRKLGMASSALKFYEHYLRVEPNPKPEIKAEVDRYIEQTRAMLDPPEVVPLPSKSAAAAAAEAVAAAPSDLSNPATPITYDRGDGTQTPGTRPTTEPATNPPTGTGTATAVKPQPSPALNLTGPAVPPKKEPTPFYKKGWFWGTVVGVVAGGAIITGVAVGTSKSKSLPPDILYPTK